MDPQELRKPALVVARTFLVFLESSWQWGPWGLEECKCYPYLQKSKTEDLENHRLFSLSLIRVKCKKELLDSGWSHTLPVSDVGCWERLWSLRDTQNPARPWTCSEMAAGLGELQRHVHPQPCCDPVKPALTSWVRILNRYSERKPELSVCIQWKEEGRYPCYRTLSARDSWWAMLRGRKTSSNSNKWRKPTKIAGPKCKLSHSRPTR